MLQVRIVPCTTGLHCHPHQKNCWRVPNKSFLHLWSEPGSSFSSGLSHASSFLPHHLQLPSGTAHQQVRELSLATVHLVRLAMEVRTTQLAGENQQQQHIPLAATAYNTGSSRCTTGSSSTYHWQQQHITLAAATKHWQQQHTSPVAAAHISLPVPILGPTPAKGCQASTVV